MSEGNPRQTAESKDANFKKQKGKTIDLIGQENIKNDSVEALDAGQLTEAVNDVPKDEAWVESKEGKIVPHEDSGPTELDSNPDPRFSKEHEFDPATVDKKAKGHKTQAGL